MPNLAHLNAHFYSLTTRTNVMLSKAVVDRSSDESSIRFFEAVEDFFLSFLLSSFFFPLSSFLFSSSRSETTSRAKYSYYSFFCICCMTPFASRSIHPPLFLSKQFSIRLTTKLDKKARLSINQPARTHARKHATFSSFKEGEKEKTMAACFSFICT